MFENQNFTLDRKRKFAGSTAIGLAALIAAPAWSQCAPNPTVSGNTTTCSGTNTDGLTVATTNTTVNVSAGASLSASNTAALTINAPVSTNYETVSVSGQIVGNGTAGIALTNGTTNGFAFGVTNLALTVAASGSVGGTNAVLLSQNSGNSSGYAIVSIDNRGTISGTSGVALLASSPAVTGFSSIINRSGGTIGAISGPVGTLTNAGVIAGGANSAINVTATYNPFAGTGAWSNTGTITSSASTATISNVSAAITNSGTISDSGAGAALSGNTLNINNQAGGTIFAAGGTALSSTGGITLNNAGTVTGNLSVSSASGSFIDSVAGTITGNASLGNGDDVIVARYNGNPTLLTGIQGTIDGGGGTNSVRIKATQDTVISTAVQLPTNFQRLQLATAYGTTLTLADGFSAQGPITFFSDPNAGGGAIVNNTILNFSGQAFTSQTYSGAGSFTNLGTIRTTGGANGTPALALDGVVAFTNNGLIDVIGEGIRSSINGQTVNTGTIVSTGTTISAFSNAVDNQGTLRSTGGTALVLSGSVGERATNSGYIEGAVAGVRTSIRLNNTGTIFATSATGTAVALDPYGLLINQAGGVIGNGNGSAAITASVFNSTVVNAGTINGSVSLLGGFSGAGQQYISLAGGVLNGSLALGAGSLLVTDIANTGPGQFAGITGAVTAGAGSSLRYRVSSNATTTLGPVGPFQAVSYELANGATLALSSAAAQTQPLQLAGNGTVNLTANFGTVSTPAIQTTTGTFYAGGPASVPNQLTIVSAGTIGLTRATNSYPGGAVVLGANDSFTNNGLITVVDRQLTFAPTAAVLNGKLVTNGGQITLDGAVGISGSVAVVNSGSITQAQNGFAAIGITGANTVDNRGTISVAGSAVQLGGTYNGGPLLSLTNSGTISSATSSAITGFFTARLDNSGMISGGSGTAVQFGFGNDIVTLRTGSDVRGVIDGGGGTDMAILAGAVSTATLSQTMAVFSNFATLNVSSGYWTASSATNSNFANGITIANGSTLEDTNGANGLTGATASLMVVNGTLVVRSSSVSAGSTFGARRISGAGSVLLTGAGTVLLDGANSLAQTGGTTIADGTTAILTGSHGGAVTTTSGGTLQIGNGGTAGSFSGNLTDNGTLVLNRSNDFTVSGGIAGSGVITKLNANTVTFAGPYTFTGVTNIQGGSIRYGSAISAGSQFNLDGTGQLDLSGFNQTIGALSGSSSSVGVNIAGGSLTVNQSGDTSFAGVITGNGSVTKFGAGRLNLTGTNSYTGPTTVSGGTLSVNGSIVSATTVTSGGTLGGNGTISAPVTIAAGGIIGPGNSIGTLNITGNLTLNAGSIYQVEANAAGQADRITVTGAAALAGTVQVLPATGTYANLTNYTILTATGGISGTFSNVTSSLAFLTPFLNYGTNAVTLTLARNDISFAAVAANGNQASVAAAVQSRGLGNALYNYVLMQNAGGAQSAFTALSGEIHASVPTSLLSEGEEVGRVVLNRASTGGDGVGIWSQAMYNLVESSARTGVAATRTDRRGGLVGLDYGHEGLRAGFAGGYLRSNIGALGRASQADVDSKIVSAYAGWSRDALMLDGGISYNWHDIHTRRTVDLGTLGGLTTAHYDATTAQLFGRAAYGIDIGAATFAPFVGYSHLRTHRESFAEQGTVAGLSASGATRNLDIAEVGLKLSGTAPIGQATLLPKLAVSYQHTWGNILGIEHATFTGTGLGFSVAGASMGKDVLRVEGGADLLAGHGFRIGGSAFGQTSGALGEYGARASLSYAF